MLGRRMYIQFGHSRIFPNMYVMLIGEPGARKSAAIRIAEKIATAASYETDTAKFAATKTSPARFWLDLEGVSDEEQMGLKPARKKQADLTDYNELSANIFGEEFGFGEPRECFVLADEGNEFFGIRNLDFIQSLGNVWDWDNESRKYEARIKSGRSARPYQPTVSILAGNTHDNFNLAFPPEILGQGFFSRLLLIYGERSERRFTIPPKPAEAATAEIATSLAALRTHQGEVAIDQEAQTYLDDLYRNWQEIPDSRFRSYVNRRFTHLLKLCLLCAVMGNSRTRTGSFTISGVSVVEANTYLTAAELLMPRALGEFGKNKNSAVINRIVELLKSKGVPMTVQQIWAEVRRDLGKLLELVDLLNGMVSANVIFHVPHRGYLLTAPKQREHKYVDWSLLTEEERTLITS